MKRVFFSILSLGIILSASDEAFAAPRNRTPVARYHQKRQNVRIHRGVQNGSITPEEQADLRTQQQDIRQQKYQARSDGWVTQPERSAIHQSQVEASQDIYTDKHN